MSPPAISVVLPFRDAAPTLREAIDSIRAQTDAHLECLLIDDGSTDGSQAIAADCAARDARLRLVHGGGGLVAALNLGVAEARAPLLARMDADDVSHPERLAAQRAALQADPSLSAVGCGIEYDGSGSGPGMRRYVDWLNRLSSPEAMRDAIFIESPLAHPSAMLRTGVLRAIGGYRSTGGPEDYDLWLRLVLAGHRLGTVARPLLRWRDRPARLSRRDPRYSAAQFFATKLAHFPRAVSTARRLEIWGAGPTGRAWARALGARGYTIRRFVDIAPRRWGRQCGGIAVESPDHPECGAFALIAVGLPPVREWITARLTARGRRCWHDYLAVA